MNYFFAHFLVVHFAICLLEYFNNFSSRLFAAPVYENEQTALESYDGGELNRKFFPLLFI